MFNQFLKYGNSYCGVESSFNVKGEAVLNVLTLKKKKKELQVESSKQFKTQEEVYRFLNSQKHIFLIVNNEQVLSKQIDYYNENQVKIIQNTFPNIKISDFYYEVYGEGENTFATICRKKYIDDLIRDYSEEGIVVIGFSLGNSSIQNLSSYINNEEFYTSNAKVILEESNLRTITREFKDENYTVNGLAISNNDMLALSGILSGYFQNENGQNIQQELKNIFFDKRIFSVGLYSFLGILFTILLVNFLLFSYYNSKIHELSSELLINESKSTQAKSINKKIITKELLIKDLNSVLQSKISWYVDEIAASVPATILLGELTYQPLKSTVRLDKEIVFDKNKILVKGISKKDTDFSSWTSELGSKEWVEEIIFQGFGTVKNNNSSFEFLIRIKND